MRGVVTVYDFDTIFRELRSMQRDHYHWLDNIADNPTCIGLHGGYRDRRQFEDKLILEWKVQRKQNNTSLLNRLEIGLLGETSPFADVVQQSIGQQVVWQPRGKGNSNNAILVTRYSDRTNLQETDAAWIRRIYPLFHEAIWQYLAQQTPR